MRVDHPGARWWLSALESELSRHGVREPAAVAGVVAEAAAHLRDSGGDPLAVLGPPDAYAVAVAESLGAGRSGGPVGWAGRAPAPRRSAAAGRVRLRATGLTKRYGRRQVLRGVDLTVRAGQIAAVVGANGCGKSTLLRVLAGFESPDAGEVVVDGRLGYCPQDGGTYDFLLPEEHFVLVGAGAGLTRDASRAAGRAWMSRLGWSPADAGPARHLSGGTRQKLNLTLSTLPGPDVLLLDEPYQGFDRGTYVNFWDELRRLRDGGAAVVVVTHLLTELDGVDLVVDLTPAERRHP